MQNEGQITNICNECVHCYMGLFMHMHGSICSVQSAFPRGLSSILLGRLIDNTVTR